MYILLFTKLAAASVISSSVGNVCLDVVNGNSAAGTAVQTWLCNTNPQQNWTYTGGTLQSLGKCLEVVNSNAANGAQVQVATCNSKASQQWKRSGNTWVWSDTFCLDLTNGDTSNGKRPQIWTCAANNANQAWNFGVTTTSSVAPTATGVGSKISAGPLCVSALGSASNGVRVGLSTCSSATSWQYSGGTVQSGGKCLDVPNGDTTPGTGLQLWDCGQGNPNQQFAIVGNTLVFRNSLCIDVPDGNYTPGQTLQIWTCYAGNANQQLTIGATTPATTSAVTNNSTTPTSVPTSGSNIRLIGRSWPGQASAASPQTFSWAASGVAVSFANSSSISISMSLQGNPTFAVILDGVQLYKISSGSDIVPITGLNLTRHTLQLIKMNEGCYGSGIFNGFTLSSGGTFGSIPAPGRRIEFIGDSITNGYGDAGTVPGCAATAFTEDATRGYAALSAQMLNAEPSLIASQGWGLYTDYQGNTDNVIPKIYNDSIYGDASKPWTFQSTDAVVINIGTNDYYQMNGNGTNFVNAYIAFLATVRQHYPLAQIFLGIGPVPKNDAMTQLKGYLDQAIKAIKSLPDTRIQYIDLTSTLYNPDTGAGVMCQAHPDFSVHQEMAQSVVTQLKPVLGW